MAFRSVLIADDEESMRHLLTVFLRDHGYEVRAVANGEDALKELQARDYDLVLSDVRMPRMDGLALLRETQRLQPELTFIAMSAYGSHDTALEAMKAGAYDYVSKPFKPDEVLLVLRKAEERQRLWRENRRLRTELASEYRVESLVGDSPPMAELLKQVKKLAAVKTTVLLTGESGTGKELIARALHDLSPRAALPFVAVNCGAIPAELMESELFGHVKGAFTDAARDKKGLAVEADGGTLFLDEIGELPLPLQVKLLRFLQEEEVRPVGGTRTERVDVRVVAATARDLAAAVQAGRFREDLYYRLDVVGVRLPPLRDRAGDVPALARHFLSRFASWSTRWSAPPSCARGRSSARRTCRRWCEVRQRRLRRPSRCRRRRSRSSGRHGPSRSSSSARRWRRREGTAPAPRCCWSSRTGRSSTRSRNTGSPRDGSRSTRGGR